MNKRLVIAASYFLCTLVLIISLSAKLFADETDQHPALKQNNKHEQVDGKGMNNDGGNGVKEEKVPEKKGTAVRYGLRFRF